MALAILVHVYSYMYYFDCGVISESTIQCLYTCTHADSLPQTTYTYSNSLIFSLSSFMAKGWAGTRYNVTYHIPWHYAVWSTCNLLCLCMQLTSSVTPLHTSFRFIQSFHPYYTNRFDCTIIKITHEYIQ